MFNSLANLETFGETTLQKEARGQQTRDGIRLFQEVDFVGMRAAGKLAAQILDEISDEVVVGQTTGEIDKID